MSFSKFMKQHYEKLLLVLVLIVAAGLLLWQVTVIQGAQSLKVDKIMNLEENPSDYTKKIVVTEERFKPEVMFSTALAWQVFAPVMPKGRIDNPEMAIQAIRAEKDMMISYELAFCPYCDKLIPAALIPPIDSLWKDSKCPQCSKILKPMVNPPTVNENEMSSGRDDNNNGIPDVWEIEYGFTVASGVDESQLDSDNDGFTNYEEFLKKTDPRNPKSHPPFIAKLSLRTVEQRTLARGRLVVNSVTSLSEPDKKKWEMDFRLPNNRTSKNYKIGDQFVFPGVRDKFELADIVFPEDVIQKNADQAIVIIKRISDNTEFRCRKGQPIVEPNMTVTFHYAIGDKEIQLKPGTETSFGTEATGIEKYTLISADKEKGEAIFKNKDGKNVKVGMSSEFDTTSGGSFAPIDSGAPGLRPGGRIDPDAIFDRRPGRPGGIAQP